MDLVKVWYLCIFISDMLNIFDNITLLSSELIVFPPNQFNFVLKLSFSYYARLNQCWELFNLCTPKYISADNFCRSWRRRKPGIDENIVHALITFSPEKKCFMKTSKIIWDWYWPSLPPSICQSHPSSLGIPVLCNE